MTNQLNLKVSPLWDTRFSWENSGIYEVVYNDGLKNKTLYAGDFYECNSFVKDCDKVNPLESLRSPWMTFGKS